MVEEAYERGLELAAEGEWFAAHEAFEDAWRAAAAEEKDFFQGLVHVVVAWYHADVTGRRRACESQIEKAARRLRAFSPEHRGVDVAALLESVERARGRFPDLPRPRFRRTRTRG